MKIDFNTKTTCGEGDDKYIKTRIKTYKDSITTNFYNKNGSKKIPEENVPHKCLSIITFHAVIYECKYAKEKIKTNNYINEELKSESDTNRDSDNDNYSDNDIDIKVQ